MNLILEEWHRFCKSIDSDRCYTVSELPLLPDSVKWIAIKHDVETNVKKALKIAEIEAQHKIRATFYIQSYLLEENCNLLNKISNLGHEVTYHYDVLDSNAGNIKKALNEFSTTIKKFKELGFPVTSVCPHGNPMMSREGWSSNKDFFRNKEIAKEFSEIFDIVVQGKEKISGKYQYISDAGYGFKVIADILNNDKIPNEDILIEDIENLLDTTKRRYSVVISTHPHRWNSSLFSAKFVKYRFMLIRKIALLASKSKFLKRIMSKFYFLAKKI